MYTDQYNSTTTFDNSRITESLLRFNDSYYLDSLPYASYSTNSYPFRQQTHHHLTGSDVYFSPYQHPFPSSSTSQLTHPNVLTYPNYGTTYLNVAVAAAYQSGYQNQYHNDTIDGSFDISFCRHIDGLDGNSNEEQVGRNFSQRKLSASVVQSSKKRKFQDETMKSQYESEPCRVCDDISSGYHFGVFTCEACKGFFRRYSKKSTILEPCPIRCCINKNNRNNCAACRYDKCKYVGMALDKIRFGKPPKIFRSSLSTSSVKLEPNDNDFQLMLKLLECYQSFEVCEQQQPTTTTNSHSSIIFQFCHRLADIVMHENERVPETFRARLKRHESTIKFLITGENDLNLSSWSKEPRAWIFAHNERWRLIMILLILAFDDEQIGGGSFIILPSNSSSPLNINQNICHSSNDTVLERILRLFELEYDQEKEARTFTEGSNICTSSTNEKNIKYMKAQFVLRFVDMMANDMIPNKIYSPTINNDLVNSYLISDNSMYRDTNELIYLPCNDNIQIQTTRISQSHNNSNEIL